MANKKTKGKKKNSLLPIYILTAVIALFIVGIVVLAVAPWEKDDKTINSEETMMEKIEALNITENPVATIEMENGGIIEVELYPHIAPNTVCNFIELANSGYYDGIIFHRCIPGFMIQGGDPKGTGTGGPGYTIKGEFTNNGFKNNLSHERGVISMARQSKPLDSAGSQFFIMVADNQGLDGDYASFGKVISGMEVADTIVAQETDPSNDKPLVPQVIKSIRVDTKGIEYPEAEKIK